MRERARSSGPEGRRLDVGDVASYALMIGAVVLGWQVLIQPLVQRMPVEVAVRLAPGSPMVLRRAAESELIAGRVDNAARLSRDALVRSPFDVRALRVLGLTEARAGREDTADEILTLAGNWSLREDPAHAWLVERRLRQGDYASSFAHADTLVRRREDIQPQIFELFTAAGAQDSRRALPVIASLLSASPPWRPAYLASLNHTPEGLQVAANLAVLLEAGRKPVTDDELQHLYRALMNAGGVEGVRTIRTRLNRPPVDTAVTNGGFEETNHPRPFQWQLYDRAGIVAQITADDLAPSNSALRVDYNGYASGTVAEQLTLFAAGIHRFTAVIRSESGNPSRLAWTVSCSGGSDAKASLPVAASGAGTNGWTPVSAQFEVPTNCPAQWLRLETRAAEAREPTVVWFDRIEVNPAR